MSKKQCNYNTRRDILSKQVYPVDQLVRLVKCDHVVKLGTNLHSGRGYWIKKESASVQALTSKPLVAKMFRDNKVVFEDWDAIQQALLV